MSITLIFSKAYKAESVVLFQTASSPWDACQYVAEYEARGWTHRTTIA